MREFVQDFEIYVTDNEWTDEKAGQYLVVYLKDDAKAFLSPTVGDNEEKF